LEVFTDQMNRTISLEIPPTTIISVVPSQTELLHSLGLSDEVIGITKFCVHPQEWFRSKTRVGGTKKLNLDKIKELKPDLIIGNKEENDEAQIKTLISEYPVWMSDISTLEDALDMVSALGKITSRESRAEEIRLAIQSGFDKLPPAETHRTAAYFIWRNPYMVAGKQTFINEMIEKCGLKNVFEQSRYPEISPEELRKASPDVILLSSEPYPFRDKHVQEFKSICPLSDIRIVDGEFFSWYGSRLMAAPSYFQELFFANNS